MLFPYQADVPMRRWPVANFALIGGTVLCWVAVAAGYVSEPVVERMVNDGWGLDGMFGSLFLHAGLVHLVGNMIFLWVFGNAVCAKLGNLMFLLTYLVLGWLSGAVHVLMDGAPAVGASGAINGVVAMFLVWYPRNNISCVYWFFFVIGGTFEVSSVVMILLWLAFDVYGVMAGGGATAYWGHLGGFAAGFALAVTLLATRLVEMAPDEQSLLDWMDIPLPSFSAGESEPSATNRDAAGHVKATSGNAGTDRGPAGGVGPAEHLLVRCDCGAKLRVSRKHAGKKGRCPKCREPLTVPAG